MISIFNNIYKITYRRFESPVVGFLLPLIFLSLGVSLYGNSALNDVKSNDLTFSNIENPMTIKVNLNNNELAFVGTITYQWQSNVKGCDSTFTDIPDATLATYDPPPGLQQTTFYRRITFSNLNGVVCSAISNCVKVTVNDVNPGSIDAPQAHVCMVNEAITITSLVPGSTTAGGTITYRWERSSSGTGPWTAITPSDSLNKTVVPVAGQTNYYRRITISTLESVSCEKSSNVVAVSAPSANLSCTIGGLLYRKI